MASPFKVSSLTLTLCIGVELNVESTVRGEDKAQLITETKAIATMRRTRKRRLAIAPWLGIMGVVVRESLIDAESGVSLFRKSSVFSSRQRRLMEAWSMLRVCRLRGTQYDLHTR